MPYQKGYYGPRETRRINENEWNGGGGVEIDGWFVNLHDCMNPLMTFKIFIPNAHAVYL